VLRSSSVRVILFFCINMGRLISGAEFNVALNLRLMFNI
jgi:hypothetical protein